MHWNGTHTHKVQVGLSLNSHPPSVRDRTARNLRPLGVIGHLRDTHSLLSPFLSLPAFFLLLRHTAKLLRCPNTATAGNDVVSLVEIRKLRTPVSNTQFCSPPIHGRFQGLLWVWMISSRRCSRVLHSVYFYVMFS
nr:hypothetical protein Iba_chr08dCG0130 [Ipomoea batatas]